MSRSTVIVCRLQFLTFTFKAFVFPLEDSANMRETRVSIKLQILYSAFIVRSLVGLPFQGRLVSDF